MCQMSRAYSAIVRSEENFPMRAMFSSDLRFHCARSSHSLVDASLRFDVRLQIGEVDVLVARAEQLRHDRAEDILVAAGEVAGGDRVDHAANAAVRAEVVLGVVAACEERRHLLGASGRR